MAERCFVYAAVGPELTVYALDPAGATLSAGSSIRLPANVQYAWPHCSGRMLYVAASDGAPALGVAGGTHLLAALRIDAATGALSPHGAPVTLPARPIHVTLDRESAYALVTFNAPAAVRTYRIAADGTLADEPRQEPSDLGAFPHQTRVTPDGRHAIVVCRGHDPDEGRREQPGGLHVFSYADGRLGDHRVVAPDGGYGFGPRHLDFHPQLPCVYVAIERQNELACFRWAGGTLEPAPRARLSTLAAGPTGAHQLASAIWVHPSGRSVAVANRAPEIKGGGKQPPFRGADNTLAVFAIDPATGVPSALEHVDSHGIHCRNLTFAADGTVLIASHVAGLELTEPEGSRWVPAGLSVFRVEAGGRLAFQRRYPLETGDDLLFWSGAVTVPAEG